MRRCRLVRRRGQTAIERTLGTAFLAIVALVALTLVGTKVRNMFSTFNSSINSTVDTGADDDDDDNDDSG